MGFERIAQTLRRYFVLFASTGSHNTVSIYSADDASQSAVVRCAIVSVFLARKKNALFFPGGLRRFVGSFQTRFLSLACMGEFDFGKSEAEFKKLLSNPGDF